MAIERMPFLHPNTPTGPSPSMVFRARCTTICVRLDWAFKDFCGRLVQVQGSSHIHFLGQAAQPKVLPQWG
eukprot:16211624-Heterocapsa_arctica.AAC.1